MLSNGWFSMFTQKHYNNRGGGNQAVKHQHEGKMVNLIGQPRNK